MTDFDSLRNRFFAEAIDFEDYPESALSGVRRLMGPDFYKPSLVEIDGNFF